MTKITLSLLTFLMGGLAFASQSINLKGNNAVQLYMAMDIVPKVEVGDAPTGPGRRPPGPNRVLTKELAGLKCERTESYSYSIPACAPRCGRGGWRQRRYTECSIKKSLSHQHKSEIYDILKTAEDYVQTDVKKTWSKTVGSLFFEKRWTPRGGPYYWINKKLITSHYSGSKAQLLYDSLEVVATPSNHEPVPYSYIKTLGPLTCTQHDYDISMSTWLTEPGYECKFSGYIRI